MNRPKNAHRRILTIGTALLSSTAVLLGSLTLAASSADAANPFPRQIRYGAIGDDNSFPAAFTTALSNPDKQALGANDFSCKTTAKHPFPVILVHGTLENGYDNWNGLSPILKDQGYCVFAPTYGGTTDNPALGGTGDMIASAKMIGPYVNKVLAATGATQVDLVGHSQGGALIRYYTDLLGGAKKVDQVIALAPSNHPTTLSGITELGKTLGLFGLALSTFDMANLPALSQQADQSPNPQSLFYRNVNGPAGETIAGENYTNIVTTADEVVTPYTQGFVKAVPGAKVDNITIQNVCANDKSEHLSLSYSKNVAQIVLNKLDPNDVRPVFCYNQDPITGSTQLIG